MEVPVVSYAQSGDVSIAYQALGEGSPDIVFLPFLANIYTLWQAPHLADFGRRLAKGRRLIVINPRGIGLSDRPRGFTVESRMDDIRAVMDDAGSERAALVGVAEQAATCAVFAASYPDRVEQLTIEAIEAFLAGAEQQRIPDTVLATVLFTDLVGSTERAVELGDRAWRELLEQHNVAVRRELERYRGVELDTAGDGFFARFDGPARAIACAGAIMERVPELGLEVRAGIHTGECERVREKIAGLAVNVCARVSGAAARVRCSSRERSRTSSPDRALSSKTAASTSSRASRGNGGSMPSAPPETRYAKSGDVNIAYQVIGEGPFDLVYVPGWVSNIELMWEQPKAKRFLDRLASFSRLILFDKRGTGMSDRVAPDALPTLEQRMDDVRVVLDAVGSTNAALLGHSEGGSMSLLFAATYPARTRALVLVGVFAKRIRSEDYPWAPTLEERLAAADEVERQWASGIDLTDYAPSEDRAFVEWCSAYLRRSASPGAAATLLRMNSQVDTRHVLPAIRVPTLVIQRTKDRDVTVEENRWVAEQIPGGRFVELPGDAHILYAGDQDAMLAEIEEFLTGTRPGPEPDRVLSTVLFTDIVDSTRRATDLGDRQWHELVD